MASSLRPRITLKYAQTLDGRVATSSGHSQWISCPETRRLAHQLRAVHDAVLVGVGTIVADDPQLNVRYCEGRDPLRIVLDTRLRTPRTARVLTDGNPTLLVTAAVTVETFDPAVEVLSVRERGDLIDIRAALSQMYDRGLRSILIEGGPTIATAFIRERMVDEVVVIIAPKLVGTGIDAVGDLHIASMEDAIEFDHVSFTQTGDDIVFRGRPLWAAKAVDAHE